MVGHRAGIVTKQLDESIQSSESLLPIRRVERGVVVTDFKPRAFQFQKPIDIRPIVGASDAVIRGRTASASRPDRFGRAESEVPQERINLPAYLKRLRVRIVEDREGELFLVRPASV